MDQSISQKIALLNQTTLDSLTEHDALKIVRHFTEIGLNILEADFGFAWWLTSDKSKYQLIYKSPKTPYEPELPRERGGNFEAKKNRTPFFVEHVHKKNYEEGFDVSPYMKSYVIIPITYATHIYGSIVLCYKKQHVFTKIDQQLAASLGNATAQSITIQGLIEKDRQSALTSAQLETRLEEEKIRTEFIMNATHEIRTPLAIIRGSADLALMKKKIPASATSAFKIIGHEVEHLSAVISDLAILISKDAGSKERNSFKEVDLNDIVETVVQRCVVIARKKKIRIDTTHTADLSVMGNKVHLERLFLNLITNAVNYGKNGGWVKVETIEIENRAVVRISDNGIGISKEDIPKIFNRFFRAEKSRDRDSGGTGLGLAIVRMITLAHSGMVDVKSTLGKGTCFTISLPLKR